jgi:formiminotetrahydrofolate cyclodeaminase
MALDAPGDDPLLDLRTPLGDWIAALSRPTATAAGGTAAALGGALAAALVGMVAGLTLQREKYAAVHLQAKRSLDRAAELSGDLVELASRDAEAFARFAEALALPKSSEAERAARETAKQTALRTGTAVQLELLGRLAEIAELASAMADGGLGSALGDATTAGFLAAAAARSAYWAIRSNVQGAPSAKATLERALALLERVEASEWRVRQLLNERVP